jgi:hypothetical protein
MNLDENQRGALIAEVTSGGPAEEAWPACSMIQ